jgi:hypothetical protein
MINFEETGGPAFPVPGDVRIEVYGGKRLTGMTLLDYFAGKALPCAYHDFEKRLDGESIDSYSDLDVAGLAYEMARAMLQARKEQ